MLAFNITTPIALDNIVNAAEQNAVVISGTADAGETQANVLIIRDSQIRLETVPVVGGEWSSTFDLSMLPDTDSGAPYQVFAYDEFITPGTASATFQKDTVAPTVQLSFAVATDDVINLAEASGVYVMGTTNAPNGSSVTLQFKSGSFSEERTVIVSSGVFMNDSSKVDVSSLPHGAVLTITASIADAAGNLGTATRQATTDFDPPPSPTVTAPSHGSLFNGVSGSEIVVTGNSGVPGGSLRVTTLPAGATYTGVADSTGEFSIPINISALPSGPVQVSVSNIDDAGNPGTTLVQINLDTLAPTLTIDSLTPIVVSNVSSYQFSGTSNALNQPVTLIFSDGTNPSVVVSATVNSAGDYSGTVNLASLQDGVITVDANVTSASGNVKDASTTVVKDASAPVLAISSIQAQDGFVNLAESSSVQFSGTGRDLGAAAGNLTYTLSGPSPATGVISGSASTYSWSLDLSTAAEGSYTLSVSQQDALGNTGVSNVISFMLDRTAPSNSTLNVTGVFANPTGAELPLSNGAVTSDSTIRFVGTAPQVGLPSGSNGTVLLKATSATNTFNFSAQTTGTGSTRSWTITTSALPDNLYEFTYAIRDAAGNISPYKNWGTLRVDTQAPAVAITTPVPGTTLSSTLPGSGSTVSGLTVTGTKDAEATTVSLVFLDVNNNSVAANAVLTSPTNWSASGVNLTTLLDGPITVVVLATDAAGNQGSSSATYTKDTTTSTPVILTPITVDNVVNIAEAELLVINGASADPGANVSLYFTDGSTNSLTQTVVANSSGGFHFPNAGTLLSAFGAVEKNITIQITSTDSAGNSATTSASFFLDTIGPEVGTAAAGNWGASVNATEQNALTITGTFLGANDRPVTITINDAGPNSASTSPVVKTVQTIASGPNAGKFDSGTIDVSSLLDGTLTITVTVTDSAGNPLTQNLTTVKDTAVPQLTINSGIAGDDVVNATESSSVHISGTADGTGTGLSTVNLEISDALGNKVTHNGVSVSGQDWGITVNLSGLVDGNITIKVSGTDEAGNASSAQRVIKKDATAPDLAINAPIQNALLNNAQASNLTISGTVSDANASVTIVVSDGVNTPVVRVAVATGNVWSVPGVNLSSLSNGQLTITVNSTDAAGNTRNISTFIRKDSAAPVITVVSALSLVNSLTSNAVTVSGSVSDNGAALAGREVSIVATIGGTVLDSKNVTTDSSGNYSINNLNLSGGPATGVITITAKVTDLAGNESQATTTVVKDAAPPNVAINQVAGNDVINLAELNGSLVVSGTTEPNRPVQIQFSNASGAIAGALVSGTANGAGVYSITVPVEVKNLLTQGSLTITASSTDEAGNAGLAERNVRLDSVAPEVLTLALVSTLSDPISATEAVSFRLTGRVSDASPAPSIAGQTVTVTLSDAINTPATANVVLTGIVTVSGSNLVFTTTAASIASLNNGQITASATVTDIAGNVSAAKTFTFNLDKVLPVAPANIQVNGNSSSGIYSTTNTPTISFTVANNSGHTSSTPWLNNANATVEIYDGSTLLGTTTLSAGAGTFTTPVLLDGVKNFRLRAIDTAGNIGPYSSSFVVTVDTIAPAISIGAIAVDDKVNGAEQNAVTISGVTESNRPVSIEIPGLAGSPFNVTSNASGLYTVTVDVSSLADNTATGYTVVARTTDAAGNPSQVTRVFKKDTAAPNIQINATLMGDNIVNAAEDEHVSVVGTQAEANKPVVISFTDVNGAQVIRTAVAGSTGVFELLPGNFADLTNLADGEIIVTATSLDDYGNAGSVSKIIRKDTVSPNLSIVAPTEGGYINSTGSNPFIFKLSGNEGQPVTFTLKQGTVEISGTQTPSTAPATLGDVTVGVLGAFAEGPVTLTVTGADVAGNQKTVTRELIIDRIAPNLTVSAPAHINASSQGAVTISGTGAHPGSTVSIRINDNSPTTAALTASAVANASGNYSVVVNVGTSSLVDSTLSIEASNSDPAGNVKTVSTSSKLDRVIGQITIDNPVAGDNVVNRSEAVSLVVSGKNAEPNANVKVTFADQSSSTPDVIRNVTANGDGEWSLASNAAGLTGLISTNNLVIKAETLDEAGNTSTATKSVVLDLVAPGLAIDVVAGDDYVNATEFNGNVTISGTSNDTAPVVITLTGVGGAATRTATVTPVAGSYSSSFNLKALTASPSLPSQTMFPNGKVQVTVTSTDSAGNVGTVSKSFILDTAPPLTPSVPTVTSDSGAYVGNLPDQSHTSDNTLTITGSVPSSGGLSTTDVAPVTKIEILNGTTVLGEATIGTGVAGNGIAIGTYQYDFSGADGTVNFRVRATDAAGNVSALSTDNAKRVTIDTVAPDVDLQDVIAGNDVINSSKLAAGIVVTGTATPNTDVTVTIYNSLTPAHNFALAATSDASGNFSITLTEDDFANAPGGAIQDGTIYLLASATDQAGNTGIDLEVVTLDRAAPSLTISSPGNGAYVNAVQATGLVVSGAREPNRAVTVTVTDSNNETVTEIIGAGPSGSYSTQPLVLTGLADGPLTITSQSTDGAGNSSSVTITVTKSTLITNVTIDSPIAGDDIVSTSEQTTLSLTGTAGPNRPILATFSDGTTTVSVGGAADSSGHYSLNTAADITTLADGPIVVTVSSTDAAGNTSSASRVILKSALAPNVSAVTSSNADGIYGLGDEVNVTITFDEPVFLSSGGIVRIHLNTGVTLETSVVVDGNKLTFLYVVGAGQATNDLTVSSMTLSGGATLKDADGNNANLAIAAGVNLAATRAIVIDTTATVVTSVGITGSGWSQAFKNSLGGAYTLPRAGEADYLRSLPWTGLNEIVVEFGDAVTGVDPADFVLEGLAGGPVTIASVTQLAGTNKYVVTTTAALASDKYRLRLSDTANIVNGFGNAVQLEPVRFNVLIGDVTGNGRLQASDVAIMRDAVLDGYDVMQPQNKWFNVVVNGSINANDLAEVRERVLGSESLPSGDFE